MSTPNELSGPQNDFFTPEFITDVCGELGVPPRANGCRPWLPSR